MQKPCFPIYPPVALALALLAVAPLPAAAGFPLPKEDVLPFRRDRLALSIDQQQTLADQLILMARVQPSETAAQRRRKAQALALAVVLSPGRVEARNLLERLSDGLGMESVESGLLDRSFLEKAFTWLDARPGEDSRALAACLKDILHPEETEQASAVWANWIPEEKAYEISAPSAESAPTPSLPSDLPAEREQPFKMATAKLDVLVTATEETTGTKTRMILHLKMSNRPSQDFTLVGNVGRWVSNLRPILEKRHPELSNGTIALSMQKRKGDAPFQEKELSAAAFVLADAAFTGREPEAVVMGHISSEGYQLPPDFWATLNEIPDGESHGRVIFPATAAEYLPAFLVQGKADFFLKNEICLASSADELVERSAKIPTDETVMAHRRFEQLMEQGKKVPIGALLADPRVRLQLEEISKALPYHASARMLAMQAAGKRPTTLPRKVTASEIEDALVPIEWVGTKTQPPDFNEIGRIDAGYESSRNRLRDFEKLVDPSDARLVTEFNEVLGKFRLLARSYKSKDVDYYGTIGIEKAFTAFSSAYVSLHEHLKAAQTDSAAP